MDQVYFLKDSSRLKEVSQKIFQDFYPSSSEVLIKIHFGEVGNKTALTPKDIQPLTEAFASQKNKLTFFDTCVMYHSPRNNLLTHKILAQTKGWGKLGKIKIGQDFQTFKAKDLEVGVTKDLIKAKNVLVISHIKGHPLAGFGGVIKNLGMGGVSPKTKKDEHCLGKPHFIGKCKGCGICVEVCPFNTVSLVNNQAEFDDNSCFGCSLCVMKCPHHCLATRKASFDDLLAQAAVEVIKHLPKKTFYVSFLKNITKLCDCMGNAGKIITSDIGVLFSENPVAIDQASLDLINQQAKGNLFEKINHKDPYLQVKYAVKYLKSSLKYQLKKI